jgi:hypothetical protein
LNRSFLSALVLALAGALPAAAQTVVVNIGPRAFDGGVTTSVTALNSSPGFSGIDLWEAIEAANNTAGVTPIVIEIDIGLTIPTLPIPLPVLTRSNVTIQGNLTSTIDGVALQPGLVVQNASNVSIIGLNFDNVLTGVALNNVTGATVATCSFGATTIFNGITVEDCSNVTVGGPIPSDGNYITKCALVGVAIDGGSDNSIQYNLIGTNPLNATGLGCARNVVVTGNTQNTLVADNTLCAALNDAIQIVGASTEDVTILRNRIGVGFDGMAALPNGTGIFVESGATNVAIGSGSALDANIIAHNDVGIRVDGGTTAGVSISNNTIFNNDDANGATADGIRLTNGGNAGIIAPVIGSVSPVVTGTAPASSVVEIYADSGDQGETYLETVTADSGTGAFTGTISLDSSPYEGLNITATARLAGDTSQFSAPVTVVSSPPSVVSIVLDDASPTNVPEVSFTVTFSEDVTGIETGVLFSSNDFALTTTVGAGLVEITGSGDTYNVTVSTGSGDGTVRLDVLQGGGIEDIAGQGMAGDYTAGPAYTIVHVKFLQDLPTGATVDEGDDVTLSVSAEGPGALSYQWYFEGVAKAPVPIGTNAPTLSLTDAGPEDIGDYYVDVTAGPETETSSTYTLAVNLLTPVPLVGGAAMILLIGVFAWLGSRKQK